MNTQPEALRLAEDLAMVSADTRATYWERCLQGAAELRRLHAENELLATASDKLRVAWRDEVHNLMKDKDQLRTQCDALLEALKDIANTDPVDAALDPQRAVRIAYAAIKAVEGLSP